MASGTNTSLSNVDSLSSYSIVTLFVAFHSSYATLLLSCFTIFVYCFSRHHLDYG